MEYLLSLSEAALGIANVSVLYYTSTQYKVQFAPMRTGRTRG